MIQTDGSDRFYDVHTKTYRQITYGDVSLMMECDYERMYRIWSWIALNRIEEYPDMKKPHIKKPHVSHSVKDSGKVKIAAMKPSVHMQKPKKLRGM